jgi:hypothetical protein
MTSRPLSSLAGLALFASRIACLIVLAAFVVFAVNQTSSASVHQQNELNGSAAPAGASAGGASGGASGSAASTRQESSLHRTLDEAANTLTSPFAGVVASSNSEWVVQLVRTALALLVYGLGIAFLVRFIRVRV